MSFSLKKMVEGQALAQEGKDVQALLGLLTLSGTERGPTLAGFSRGGSSHQC